MRVRALMSPPLRTLRRHDRLAKRGLGHPNRSIVLEISTHVLQQKTETPGAGLEIPPRSWSLPRTILFSRCTPAYRVSLTHSVNQLH